jgi:uncharacterized protein YjbJ (UPF0337 family)
VNWESERNDGARLRGDLKARWNKLSDGDLDDIAGDRQRLILRLRELYGSTDECAVAEVHDWERHQEPIDPRPKSR